jgi:phosphatidylserine/phosphatidylglycerophosphate/cardiolipin synthase-like enzyme
VLEERKAKWFVHPGATGFPPARRHAKSTVADWTDNNRVVLRLDASNHFAKWADALLTATDGGKGILYLAGWQLHDVEVHPALPQSMALIRTRVARGELRVRALISDHLDANAKAYLSALGAVKGADLLALIDGLEGFVQRRFPRVNTGDVCAWQAALISTVLLDGRFPSFGSAHQKFSVFLSTTVHPVALVGIDISAWRLDTPAHTRGTHDVGVSVEGPAVKDLVDAFSVRWLDHPTEKWVRPLGSALNCGQTTFGSPSLADRMLPPHLTLPATPIAGGGQSVQVLETYGKTDFGYSWQKGSSGGEFTIWRAYINAIGTARRYIYIEDQYFLPFGAPPHFDSAPENGPVSRDAAADVVFSLGVALRRGVHVIVMLPQHSEDANANYQEYQLALGIKYLTGISKRPKSGRFIVATPYVSGKPIFVHAKLLICDDEYVLLGSANVCRRSFTHDGELSLAIVDGYADGFAQTTRQTLWTHHTGVDSPADISKALSILGETVDKKIRLHAFVLPKVIAPPPLPAALPKVLTELAPSAEMLHEVLLDRLIDPYAGPA